MPRITPPHLDAAPVLSILGPLPQPMNGACVTGNSNSEPGEPLRADQMADAATRPTHAVAQSQRLSGGPEGPNPTRDLAEETPVAITCNGSTQAVMMATPADLTDFAYGFALTEGFVTCLDEIETHELVVHETGIEARLWLSDDRAAALGARRRAMAGPVGCGLCGIDSLQQALRDLPIVAGDDVRFDPAELRATTDLLRQHQPLHDRTGAVHAAGFALPGQGIVLAREDVGRHNALDKLIGALARADQPASAGALILTSRLSVELIQKCAIAGCGLIVAVSAPTRTALQLAQEAGITLVANVRKGGGGVYTHPHRVRSLPDR
ncbi:MAG: formate dehydrogenase accessory sulfurtransferase FdhD [Celeribacter sp.]|jgi:FdhD protein